MDKLIDSHCFEFGEQLTGGESLSLQTDFYMIDDEEGRIYYTQKIVLQSYTNSASINLHGTKITPDELRTLANQLEKKINLLQG